MVAVAAGDAAEAARQSKRADSLLADPPLTMLLAAQAAQLGGDEAAAQRYFTAMLERPETAFLGVRGLLMQAERAGDRVEMRRLIERAHAMRPQHAVGDARFARRPGARRALARGAGHAEPRRQGARARAPPTRGARRRRRTSPSPPPSARPASSPRRARHARKALRADPEFAAAAIGRARIEAAAGNRRTARKLIEAAWPRTPHPELLRLYLRVARRRQCRAL